MNDITFFHCADLHLETPFKTLASKPGLPVRRRSDIFNNLKKLIDAAKTEKPDFLFISGDLFEHEYAGLKTISAVNSLFCQIPETNVIMIAGNHDPEAANSFYNTFKWNHNVTFLGNETTDICFNELNTHIFGLGWVSGTGQAGLLEAAETFSDRINILMFHGDIDLKIGDRDYNSVSSELILSKGFDYVAAGHNHKRKEGETGGIFYNPGSLEPLGFDEPGPHGYFKGSITKGELPKVEFLINSSTEYVTIEADITGKENDTQVFESVSPVLSNKEQLYKIVLTGTKEIDYSPDTSTLESMFSEITLFSKVRDESTILVSVEALSVMKGLKGVFTRHMLERIENSDENEKPLLEKALYYGIDAIENKKIERAGGEDL